VRNPVPVSSATIHVRKGVDGKVLAPSTAAAVWEREACCLERDEQVTGATGSAGNRGRGAPGSVSDRSSARMPGRIIRKDAIPKREDASVRAWVEGTPRKLNAAAMATWWVRDARPEQGLEAEERGTSVLRDNGEEAGSLETGHPLGSGRASKGKGTLGEMSESRRKPARRQETG
jgi:hypothetical protein